jgi:uncharacterized membrane protein YedE/YeeE
MKQIAFSLLCGLVFGAGLVLSGMTDPEKIHAFLSAKDASMAFVMGSAVITCAALYAIARRRNPAPFAITQSIDGKLVTGAAIFGVGWGLVGACPAPAIVALGSGATWAAVFVVAMIVGARIESMGSRFGSSDRFAPSRPTTDTRSGTSPSSP